MNPQSTAGPVYTIGHSTRELQEVVEMLRGQGVEALVDVRSYPSSRKFPQWNRESLEMVMPADIAYQWMPKLGGRRHTPAGTPSPNKGWRVKAFRDYADYMGTDSFREGLHELIQLAKNQKVAIMCSEAVSWRCHRRLITDALLVRGIPVLDIISPSSLREASLTDFAVYENGTLTYPVATTL